MKILWGLLLLLLTVGCGSVLDSAPAAPSVIFDSLAIPVRLEVSSIGADSTLVHVSTDSEGRMQVPDVKTPQQGAWYRESAVPGEPGPGVYLAHVNGGGRPGLFARLSQIKPGAKVRVTLDDSQVFVYTITAIETVDKDDFPTQKVYGSTQSSEIRLITCGGVFVGGDTGYEDNVIAYGTLD